MALIWAENSTGKKALAPAWRRYVAAQARADAGSPPLSPAELGEAIVAARDARREYDQAVADAEAALAVVGAGGEGRTHVLVAGVGSYDDPSIKGLTTSVHGAIAFAEWMLTRFQNPDRPLGSVEVLLAPGDGQGDRQPGAQAAAALGLAAGDTLPLEAPTFQNLEAAFANLLRRAAAQPDSAAWFYFSGHGVWKSHSLILPTDALLPSNRHGAANLIDVDQTCVNMFNIPPGIQCFFIDACQELPLALLQNLGAAPGDPLVRPSNGKALNRRDQCIYQGAYPTKSAFGPEDRPPFFTQELLSCLERRGARGRAPGGAGWTVTTDSLRSALAAAWPYRAEVENKDIVFSTVAPGSSSITADLCRFTGPPEVFVQVWCRPRKSNGAARLFVADATGRRFRTAPRPSDWYTTVEAGDCEAGAEFAAATGLSSSSTTFSAAPPIFPIELSVNGAAIPAGAGGAGGGRP